MDLDKFFEENPMGGIIENIPEDFKSGFVTFIGRPNAGKSSITNKLVGKKVAITSNTSQTTRRNLQAVVNGPDFQIVIVDTPGIHKPKDALGKLLNKNASSSLEDVDVIAMVIDASQDIGRGDEWVAGLVSKASGKRMCILNKCDLVDEAQLSRQVERASSLCDWDALIIASAKSGYNIRAIEEEIVNLLPYGNPWFPEGMDTDMPIELMVSEMIREKILRSFHDEIPHAVGVVCDSIEFLEKRNLYRIFATVYVERESQKAMIIGKGGAAIKSIGINARKDLEKFLDGKVYLELSVNVRKNWRNDDSLIERIGQIE